MSDKMLPYNRKKQASSEANCLLPAGFLLHLLFDNAKMESMCSSEMSMEFYQTMWHYIQEDK
jgi:hypothetical protein